MNPSLGLCRFGDELSQGNASYMEALAVVLLIVILFAIWQGNKRNRK